MTSYRYSSEIWILLGTVLLLITLLLVAAGVSFCAAPLLFLLFLVIIYFQNKAHHKALITGAMRVTPSNAPAFNQMIQSLMRRLQPGDVQVFIVKTEERNAYTFGLSKPEVIVMYSSLFDVMDDAEIRFILGHEMGHVALGHTWLNSLLGGMAGVPVSLGAAVILTLAFQLWSRACEYSADRAGLLACGNLQKATLALVKLVAGDIHTDMEYQRALAAIDREDDSLGNVLMETFSSHPMIIRRITQLRKYAASDEYRRLQAQINRQG
jgi:Zn-dependent protease with chaperone function